MDLPMASGGRQETFGVSVSGWTDAPCSFGDTWNEPKRVGVELKDESTSPVFQRRCTHTTSSIGTNSTTLRVKDPRTGTAEPYGGILVACRAGLVDSFRIARAQSEGPRLNVTVLRKADYSSRSQGTTVSEFRMSQRRTRLQCW
jgi:hypothetical protein